MRLNKRKYRVINIYPSTTTTNTRTEVYSANFYYQILNTAISTASSRETFFSSSPSSGDSPEYGANGLGGWVGGRWLVCAELSDLYVSFLLANPTASTMPHSPFRSSSIMRLCWLYPFFIWEDIILL